MSEAKVQKVLTIEDLTQKILSTEKRYDLSKILSAYEFARSAHGDQKRSSGEPYIVHPLSVAEILVDLGMDTDSVCAGLLHDVVEDTEYTLDDIGKRFGGAVARLVDGLTKINQLPHFDKEEQQAGNFMKVLLAMSTDIRVMIIKLADRLHNIRTLRFLPPHKQRRIAKETLSIYVPIARRMGMRTIYAELEDLSFRFLDPYAYSEIEHVLLMKKEKREAFIESVIERLRLRLSREQFQQEPAISGRVKSIYGIYNKVYVNHKNIEEIYDKYAVRVIVSTDAECYQVLGIVHSFFCPLENRFKDYIAKPKSNMYQSLHTTVTSKEGIPFEIQIRTWDMHKDAEYGIAAHWKYKEGIEKRSAMDARLAWVRQMIEIQQTSDDVEEIVSIIKNDLTPEEIVVMSPKGDSFRLPKDSIVLDFAYRLHSEIGHKAIGAKVDSRMVPIDYVLKTGEICEVITTTDPHKRPTRDWLKLVRTNEAKSKIRSWLKREMRSENIILGKAELEQEFKRFRIVVPEQGLEEFLADDLKRHNCETLVDFYASIGYGGTTLSKMMPRLKEKYMKRYGQISEQETQELPLIERVKSDEEDNAVVIDKIDDVAYKLAKCCSPMPGDSIIGFVTRGYGISIHTRSCINYQSAMKNQDAENRQRWIAVKWKDTVKVSKIAVHLEVLAVDRIGLSLDVFKVIAEQHISLINSISRTLPNGNAIVEVSLKVDGTDQLQNIISKLRKIKGVISVDRARK
ncbi:MAG: bifunctional (p)ppGpp synthetase/guanosine-3',5'-bis(diphosphate) 3'-pyrophosphohydrolase [Ruminococcus sp.]|nr:bifunctional (p)ppGpp synthetase/guanosine-3',5'-bis(diphosphate) 3'-pyrophosphohydrolase [Ruminococcus sp.]